jgi:hypothetical protein
VPHLLAAVNLAVLHEFEEAVYLIA